MSTIIPFLFIFTFTIQAFGQGTIEAEKVTADTLEGDGSKITNLPNQYLSTLFSHIPDSQVGMQPLTIDLSTSEYIVPLGKNLYIKNFYPKIQFKDLITNTAPVYHYVFNEEDTISCEGANPCHAIGFLVNRRTEFVFISIAVDNFYQVPNGKFFIIYDTVGLNNLDFVDGNRLYYMWNDLIFNKNQLLEWPNASQGFIFGYLLDI